MRKVLSLALAFMLVVAAAPAAFAANTTTLTTTVPPATYTLNIPADQTIDFGATSTDIGNVTVTDSAGFATGKNLAVTVAYTSFKSETVETTIPCSLYVTGTSSSNRAKITSGSSIVFNGTSNGNVKSSATWISGSTVFDISGIKLEVSSFDWSRALAGNYTTTITFSAEVVIGG